MIDLGEMTTFDKLEYVSRNGNGSVRDYTLEISADGEQWETISEGTMPKAGATMLEFEETQTARYVRLHVESSYGVDSENEDIFASAAELSLYRTNPAAVDYRALIEVIRQAQALQEADYTAESWMKLETALQAAAETAMDVNAVQERVNAAEQQLHEAIEALVLISGDQASDAAIQALRNMIDKAIALGSDDAALTEAIVNAQAVLDKEAPTTTEVITALLNLSEAMQALNTDESADVLRADVQATIDFIKEHILTNVEGLRPAKVQALKDAVKAAQDVVNDPDTTADELKAANKAMTKAAQELWEIVTKAELEALIEAANGYIDGDYTAESLEALQAAITAAQAVAANDDATTSEVTEAITNLADAIAGLENTLVDTSALEHEIELTRQILANIDDYVPSTVEGLQEKLDVAINALNAAESQEAVDAATEILREARLTARTKADTRALEELIIYAMSLDMSGCTTESAAEVIQAVEQAKLMAADPEATQEDVDAKLDALQNAIDGLVQINDGSTDADTEGGANADSANTAAEGMTNTMFALTLAAGAAAIAAYRRKKN